MWNRGGVKNAFANCGDQVDARVADGIVSFLEIARLNACLRRMMMLTVSITIYYFLSLSDIACFRSQTHKVNHARTKTFRFGLHSFEYCN